MIHAIAWLLIGYSDGAIYHLIETTGVNGYLIYLTPVFVLYVGCLFFVYRLRITERLLWRQTAVALSFMVVGLSHSVLVGGIYVEGYLQLFVMVSMILMLTDLFADNADALRPGFAKAMLMVHYIICGYVVLSWVIFRQFDLDISLFIGDLNEIGREAARISGLHREPSWAGYAVASSYLAVQLTRGKQLLAPLGAFLVAIAVTGAGAGLLFAALFCGHQIMTARRTSLIFRLGLLAGVTMLAVIVFGARIAEVLNNSDGSTQMRIESAVVAAEVIADSFPIGTGYGNYRDVADFDLELWRGFINLDEADYYKSDLLVLNLVAELGLFGCGLVIFLIHNFFCRRSMLPAAMVALMMITAGSLVLPFYLVLSALAGLEIARTRAPAGRLVAA